MLESQKEHQQNGDEPDKSRSNFRIKCVLETEEKHRFIKSQAVQSLAS